MDDSALVSSLLERHFESLGISTTLSSDEFFDRIRDAGDRIKDTADAIKARGQEKIRKARSQE